MMNKEVAKAMNKKENGFDTMRKWWNKNGYKVMRVILFPIWWGFKAKEKIDNHLNAKEVWSEKRAEEIFNYYIPRSAKWNEEDKTFYICHNFYGWHFESAKKHLKFKDRRFWKMHNGFGGGELRKYLVNEFELKGFTKEVNDCDHDWTEIAFRMIEK